MATHWTLVYRELLDTIVMLDPEGNEFCVA